MLGSKMISSGGESDVLRQDAVGARADLGLALERVRLPCSSNAITDDGRAIAAHEAGLRTEILLPSFMEMEFTMPLPECISGRLR